MPPSSSPRPRVAHYIVYGEGVRDSHWRPSIAAPLEYNPPHPHQLLRVRPSPRAHTTPVVRIFPTAAHPRYIVADAVPTNVPPHPAPISASASTSTSNLPVTLAASASPPPTMRAGGEVWGRRGGKRSPQLLQPEAGGVPAVPPHHVFSGASMIARPGGGDVAATHLDAGDAGTEVVEARSPEDVDRGIAKGSSFEKGKATNGTSSVVTGLPSPLVRVKELRKGAVQTTGAVSASEQDGEAATVGADAERQIEVLSDRPRVKKKAESTAKAATEKLAAEGQTAAIASIVHSHKPSARRLARAMPPLMPLPRASVNTHAGTPETERSPQNAISQRDRMLKSLAPVDSASPSQRAAKVEQVEVYADGGAGSKQGSRVMAAVGTTPEADSSGRPNKANSSTVNQIGDDLPKELIANSESVSTVRQRQADKISSPNTNLLKRADHAKHISRSRERKNIAAEAGNPQQSDTPMMRREKDSRETSPKSTAVINEHSRSSSEGGKNLGTDKAVIIELASSYLHEAASNTTDEPKQLFRAETSTKITAPTVSGDSFDVRGVPIPAQSGPKRKEPPHRLTSDSGVAADRRRKKPKLFINHEADLRKLKNRHPYAPERDATSSQTGKLPEDTNNGRHLEVVTPQEHGTPSRQTSKNATVTENIEVQKSIEILCRAVAALENVDPLERERSTLQLRQSIYSIWRSPKTVDNDDLMSSAERGQTCRYFASPKPASPRAHMGIDGIATEGSKNLGELQTPDEAKRRHTVGGGPLSQTNGSEATILQSSLSIAENIGARAGTRASLSVSKSRQSSELRAISEKSNGTDLYARPKLLSPQEVGDLFVRWRSLTKSANSLSHQMSTVATIANESAALRDIREFYSDPISDGYRMSREVAVQHTIALITLNSVILFLMDEADKTLSRLQLGESCRTAKKSLNKSLGLALNSLDECILWLSFVFDHLVLITTELESDPEKKEEFAYLSKHVMNLLKTPSSQVHIEGKLPVSNRKESSQDGAKHGKSANAVNPDSLGKLKSGEYPKNSDVLHEQGHIAKTLRLMKVSLASGVKEFHARREEMRKRAYTALKKLIVSSVKCNRFEKSMAPRFDVGSDKNDVQSEVRAIQSGDPSSQISTSSRGAPSNRIINVQKANISKFAEKDKVVKENSQTPSSVLLSEKSVAVPARPRSVREEPSDNRRQHEVVEPKPSGRHANGKNRGQHMRNGNQAGQNLLSDLMKGTSRLGTAATTPATSTPNPFTRPGKKKVTFCRKLVSGVTPPRYNRQDATAFFHDGPDILGSYSQLQDVAVAERGKALQRGAVFATLGMLQSYLRSMIEKVEGKESKPSGIIRMPYTAPALRSIERHLRDTSAARQTSSCSPPSEIAMNRTRHKGDIGSENGRHRDAMSSGKAEFRRKDDMRRLGNSYKRASER